MRRLFLFVAFTHIVIFSFSQQFGANPSSAKWKQINTDSARIIYPPGLDSQAQRVAAIVHYLAKEKPVSIGDQIKKINIVLQNQTTIPNGYAQLGPFRTEFFMTPDVKSFNQGSIGWGDQLALHEYRHIQQYNNFNNGLSKFMKVVSGEEGYAVAINAAIPDWFFEGDAVYQETVLTKQGRGRLPLFLNAYPSLWQAAKKYSWMKLRNGSLKDYVPNHYYLGYLLVNYGREQYGDDFWKKVTNDASAYKGLFYPFQTAIQKYAGVNYKTFRKEAFEFYKKKTERVSTVRDEYIKPVKKSYVTNYYFPYGLGSDSLIYLKTSYRHRPAFYIKDAKGEHRIKTRDISIDQQFSYRNGRIVYAAYETDARWGWKDYSVIKLLDIGTGLQKSITRKSKYFTPDISSDGNRVAAVKIDENGKSELHVINVYDGQVINMISSPQINLFTDPKFLDNENIISAIRLHDGKMYLAKTNVSTGETVQLTSPSFNVVGYPCISNGVIYYTASYGGNDDVFALKLADNKIYKISDGPLGNYNVNVAGGRITWSSFTAEGYQLKQLDEKNIKWTAVASTEMDSLKIKFQTNSIKGDEEVLSGKIIQQQYPVSEYKKSTKLINIHSWRPNYDDPIFSYSIYGQNVLNTLQTEFYYQYNENERTNAAGVNAVYGALFPYLSLGTEYTFNRSTTIGSRVREWGQLDSRIGLSIPLNWASGQTFKNFNLSSNYVLRNEYNKGFYKDSLGKTSFSYLLHTLSWTHQVQRAVQHIYPRFAYSVSANQRHAITSVKGNQFIATGSLYVPGFLSTHNLILTASIQERDTLGQLVFSNRFAYSRGYEGRYFARMWRMSANYHLPLLYPDWGFGSILYLQRIRANIFYDFTKVYSRDKKTTRDQRSAGGEIFMDTKWWNQHPLTFGFRVSKLLDQDQFDGYKGMRYEFVLPVSIVPR